MQHGHVAVTVIRVDADQLVAVKAVRRARARVRSVRRIRLHRHARPRRRGNRNGIIDLMQRDRDGSAVIAVDVRECLNHTLGRGRVKRGDRFVGQDDFRALGPGDYGVLLLAGRQGGRALTRHPGDPDTVKGLRRRLLFRSVEQAEGSARARNLPEEPGQQVGQDRAAVDQIELLEDDTDLCLDPAGIS